MFPGGTVAAKDEIINDFDDANDLLLVAWTGQYKTYMFKLTKSDLDGPLLLNQQIT